jgi:hypothetical protein
VFQTEVVEKSETFYTQHSFSISHEVVKTNEGKRAINQTFLELFMEECVSFGAYKDMRKKNSLHYLCIYFTTCFSLHFPTT